MSRHSVQIKALLQSKRLSKSRFNPESSMKCIPPPAVQNRNLKRSQSSSSLRMKQPSEMMLIEQRFRKLEQNYRAVLQQTKNKANQFAKQKIELEKSKAQNEKDKKQIQRLRAMLGFSKKNDFAVQADIGFQSTGSFYKTSSKVSTYSKVEKSTDIGMRQTADNWNMNQRKKTNRKQSRVNTSSSKQLNNKSQTTIYFRSPLKESNVKSPLSKYKFVPTLSFN